jgi:hypothetical protein
MHNTPRHNLSPTAPIASPVVGAIVFKTAWQMCLWATCVLVTNPPERRLTGVMISMLDAEHWRRRADELRRIAGELEPLPLAKESVLRTAEGYESAGCKNGRAGA